MKTLRGKAEVRKLHRQTKAHASPMEIAFLLQDWDDPYNVGGMFRIADAVGATELFMTGHTPLPPHPQISVTSLGQHRRVSYRHWPRHEDAAIFAKEQGYSLIAVEIAEGAVPYGDFSYPEKVCFILGNEARGVYGGVLKHCDTAIYIPMFGKGRSMNVHVAAAIVAFRARLENS